MWSRIRERLLSGVVILLMLAWFAGSIGIAIWLDDRAGLDLSGRGAVALVSLIWLVPIGVATAVDELVIRRIRYGPPTPGRRKRTL